jgi:hypothetical protein
MQTVILFNSSLGRLMGRQWGDTGMAGDLNPKKRQQFVEFSYLLIFIACQNL